MKSNLFLVALFLIATAFIFSNCGEDEVPVTATIKGTISFENSNLWSTWQDSGEVQITIFPAFSLDPLAGWGEIPDNFFGPGVPGGVFAAGAPYNSQNPIILAYESGKSNYDYELEVDPGTYSALAIGFRHDFVNDPTRRSATLGVHWNQPTQVSHGIVLKVDVGGGNIIPIFNFSPPAEITVQAGDEITLDIKADFGFVEQWF